MAITFPIDLPLDDVTTLDVGEFNASSVSQSQFTGKLTVQIFSGDYWTVTLRYRGLDRALAQPVLAFRSALRGSAGTFVAPYPGNATSRGTAATIPSSPAVNGGAQAGNSSLLVKNAPASQVGWLVAGDIIQVGPDSRPHWHRVLADVTTDGGGLAEIEVWPIVRSGTIDNDKVGFEAPLCLFRKTGETDASITSPVIYNLDIDAREET